MFAFKTNKRYNHYNNHLTKSEIIKQNLENKIIKIIDLFAGPGGLGEGFSSLKVSADRHPFKIALSIENDPQAHKTLELRSFYRQFRSRDKDVPEEYYKYIRGEINRDKLFEQYNHEASLAQKEARLATLGEEIDEKEIHEWIEDASGFKKNMTNPLVLIGGPPCQAYSLVGRSRNKGNESYTPENDERHYLYREYLKIIAKYWPSVFVKT